MSMIQVFGGAWSRDVLQSSRAMVGDGDHKRCTSDLSFNTADFFGYVGSTVTVTITE